MEKNDFSPQNLQSVLEALLEDIHKYLSTYLYTITMYLNKSLNHCNFNSFFFKEQHQIPGYVGQQFIHFQPRLS